MTDLTDVLQRATRDLAPATPDALVAGALRRGRSLRRRRRAGAATAAAGVAGLAVAVAIGGSALRSGPGIAPAPLTTGDPTSAVPSPPPAPSIGVPRDQVGDTFARIVPGTITAEHDVAAGNVHSRGAYESTFDWNGYLVSVQISPYDGVARDRCRAVTGSRGSGQSCVRVDGGWSVHDDLMDAQALNRWASVFRDNGFRMWVLIYNSGSEKGSASVGPPPLDVPALEKVATSDLWFS